MFFSDKPTLPITLDQHAPPTNAPVLVTSKVINAVMSLAQESETGAGFNNACNAIPIKNAAIELGHPQGPTLIQFDNKCAVGILTDTVKQKDQRRCTCDSTGYETESDKTNFMSTRKKEKATWLICQRNITRWIITLNCDRNTFSTQP